MLSYTQKGPVSQSHPANQAIQETTHSNCSTCSRPKHPDSRKLCAYCLEEQKAPPAPNFPWVPSDYLVGVILADFPYLVKEAR